MMGSPNRSSKPRQYHCRHSTAANERGIPKRPGVLFNVPPVDVPAAMLPLLSRATAPTVSCEMAGANKSCFCVAPCA